MADAVTLTFELDDARDRQAVLAAAAGLNLSVIHVTDKLFHVEVKGADPLGTVGRFGQATMAHLMKVRRAR